MSGDIWQKVLAALDSPAFYFQPANRRNVFTAFKDYSGVFQQVPEEEARELQQQLRGIPREQRGRR